MNSWILLTFLIHALYALSSTDGLSIICSMKPETGPCRGYFPRFYYDAGQKKCKKFIYGGCRGNMNNFQTLQACESTCNPQDPCSDVSCKFGGKCQVKNGEAKCHCSEACTMEYLPVCGHDGTEYPNPCALRVAECEAQKEIKYDEGPCRWH